MQYCSIGVYYTQIAYIGNHTIIAMTGVQKCLSLNVLPLTKVKQNSLSKTYSSYFELVNKTLDVKKQNPKLTQNQLHSLTYKFFREQYKFPSQLIISARVTAWDIRKQKGEHKRVAVRFDKRLFSLRETKRNNPILSLRCNNSRIGIPIAQDGAFEHFQQHLNNAWDVTSIIMTKNFRFYAVLTKEFPEPKPMPNVLGIDINSGRIALSIYNPRTKRWLRQLYFGKDIFLRQVKYEVRRGILQGYRDTTTPSGAGKKLKILSGTQKNYVRTRIWQIVSEIIELAKEYKATIIIEEIKHLRVPNNKWRKKSRKKVNRIPYGFFRFALEHKAAIEGFPVIAIDPKYTSQTCPRCGNRSRTNWKHYALFGCKECGFEANRDRVASQNICLRADNFLTPVNNIQISRTGAAVNQPVCPVEGACS
ncbi:MAG: transposase, partial [Candidatus Thermoplasmatota archaeon]